MLRNVGGIGSSDCSSFLSLGVPSLCAILVDTILYVYFLFGFSHLRLVPVHTTACFLGVFSIYRRT